MRKQIRKEGTLFIDKTRSKKSDNESESCCSSDESDARLDRVVMCSRGSLEWLKPFYSACSLSIYTDLNVSTYKCCISSLLAHGNPQL